MFLTYLNSFPSSIVNSISSSLTFSHTAALRLCLTLYKMFSGENIFCKEKNFLLFNSIVEITLENYFMCFVLHVKKLFLENVSTSQPPATTTIDKHNPPPTTQNPDWEEEKKTTTTALLPPKSIKTPPPIPPQQIQNQRSKKKKIK